ncbi:MAG: TetR/AcrR family transcriptional regulator [Bifidobacteriaceae bacterium]|jgi:AcrR family transcriptional regulator|nr:TetR/AcrR family transcriptional regulator [Bifidobacteriaceae bacterium]
MRVAKKRDVRLNQILDAAQALFGSKGYEQATINDILEAVEIGKGTFYHYFQSKQDVMEAVVARIVNRMAEQARLIADDATLDAHSKIGHIIAAVNLVALNGLDEGETIIDELHKPANAQFHEKSITETVKAISPIMADAVQQGIAEGVYQTPYPLETVQFLLVGSQNLLDRGIFDWGPAELAKQAAAIMRITELSLGAAEGSFAFLLERLAGNNQPDKSM